MVRIAKFFGSVVGFGLLVFGTGASHAAGVKPQAFRFHLLAEPTAVHPVRTTGSETGYLESNLYRGLFWYDDKKGVIPDGAQSCKRPSSLQMVCKIRKDFRWSDGSSVTAEDFVKSLRYLVSPQTRSREAGLLLSLVKAREVLAGSVPSEQLGVRAQAPDTLVFDFVRPDFEFEAKLTVTATAAYRDEKVFNGPYVLKSWEKGKKILLEPNPHYVRGGKNRPPVEIYVVEEDSTALTLYNTGRLDFDRRLPTSEVAAYRSSKEFFNQPMARFDYIGFGPELKDQREFRKALAMSADYEGFAKLFWSLGRPGCPGYPEGYADKMVCLDFRLDEARAAWSQVPEELRKKKWAMGFSKLGGDDIRRVAEWYQAQWKKNLGVEIELQPKEQGVYLAELKHSPPPLFRRGTVLDRPTCLSALETFGEEHDFNFIRLKDPSYEKLLNQLATAKTDSQRRPLCRKAMEILIRDFWLIPQGRIHFSMLLKPYVKGLKLNELNQLDLSELSLEPH